MANLVVADNTQNSPAQTFPRQPHPGLNFFLLVSSMRASIPLLWKVRVAKYIKKLPRHIYRVTKSHSIKNWKR